MKHLFRIILIASFLSLLIFGISQAQSWTTYSNSQKYRTGEFKYTPKSATKVNITGLTDASIKGYNGKEIVIKAEKVKETPERAKGLKAVSYNAIDNTKIGLSVLEENGEVNITLASPIAKNGKFDILIPDNMIVDVNQESVFSSKTIEIKNLKNEINLKTMVADIKISNCTGPVVLSSLSGKIEVELVNINYNKPISINSVSGLIDLSLPASVKADLELQTISGEIYTDFDIKLEKKKDNLTRIGGNSSIKAKLKGGGLKIDLQTVSGNIYLRKK